MATTLTRVTHSCALLDFDGQALLTDPWFSEKPGYYRGEPLAFTRHPAEAVGGRRQPRPRRSLRPRRLLRLPDKTVPFIVKRGMGDKARRAGFTNVTEAEPWDEVTVGGLRMMAAPARHGVPITSCSRARARPSSSAPTPYGFPAGRVPRRFGDIDLAPLPINGLRIRPFNRQVVMSAEEAGEYCAVLRPKVAVPIHFAFTAGPVRDRLFLKYDGTPERFQAPLPATPPRPASGAGPRRAFRARRPSALRIRRSGTTEAGQPHNQAASSPRQNTAKWSNPCPNPRSEPTARW